MGKYIEGEEFYRFKPGKRYCFTVKDVEVCDDKVVVHILADGRFRPHVYFYYNNYDNGAAGAFFKSIGVSPFKWERCRGRSGLCTLKALPPKVGYDAGYVVPERWISSQEEEEVVETGAIHATKVPCKYSNTIHDSKLEARRCEELHEALLRGEIRNLQEHVRYELIPPIKYENQHNEGGVDYTSDFNYQELNKNGEWIQVVEDVKCSYTAKLEPYVQRRKMFKALYCKGRDDVIFREHIMDK